MHRNYESDLELYLKDIQAEVPSHQYIETYEQLIAKLDTEYALYLH